MDGWNIAAEEAARIEGKLQEIGMVLLAMNKLAISHGCGVDGGTLATAVESMSKQALRAIDGCIVRLDGIPMGNFAEVECHG